MRERINRLAKGIVDAEAPVLCITPESIEKTVQAGELTIGEVYIVDVEGRFVKGLVYSSNIRVRVLNQTFGGNRNHISYEVDAANLTKGDVIQGTFYLVTNGGEKKVPYSFSIELGISKRTLEGLKTPEDFAEIAKKDQDMAQRLFEYQDFADAPFMKDLHIRTLYDGLKGHANRWNLLEEFLVALKVKEPVTLKTDRTTRQYDGVSRLSKDFLEIQTNTWGYVQFEAAADGDFLELQKKSFSIQDFSDGICKVPFLINPTRLHHGRNLGRLTISTVRDSFDVCVEVLTGEEELEGLRHRSGQAGFAKYLELRVEYELGLFEKTLLINQMKQELEDLQNQHSGNCFYTMLQAELCLMGGEIERATAYLEEIRHQVMEQRFDKKEWHCFYQYLLYQVSEKKSRRDALLRLIQKILYEEQGHPLLYLLQLKLEPEDWETPAEILEELEQHFERGCRSPFLYAIALRIYKEHPKLMKSMSGFALQVMVFAAKYGVINRELALCSAEFVELTKHYQKLYCRLLIGLYEKYPEKELLNAICSMLIKGNCRDSQYFPWYEKALQEGICLTSLYEYFLYALPKNYGSLLPREALLYFSYDKWLDSESRSALYVNILTYMDREDKLYRQYERDIEQFAMDQLLESRINSRLVVLYEHMLYKEMIDERVAKVLPEILNSYRVELQNRNMKYVIVCYEELEEEVAFLIQDGAAYVPLYLERSVLLFQDAYGNRYANIPYQKIPVMNHDTEHVRELEEQCYDICPAHPMLRLQECGDIVEMGILSEADFAALKRIDDDLNLRSLYRKQIFSQMISYYMDCVDAGAAEQIRDTDFLKNADIGRLSRKERARVCETLILQEHWKESYEMIRKYGAEEVRSRSLLKLCVTMIQNKNSDEEDILTPLSFRLFSEGCYDSAVLEYLCRRFNGSTKQMYRILSCGEQEQAEVYDLPERLLAQMMFSGETERLDQVFEWYAEGKRTNDEIVKAYFTMKSADYFLKERPTGERVFTYLESVVQGMEDKSRIPTIYLLALTKYDSTLDELSEEQKKLCTVMVELLMNEGRIFAYYQELGKRIPMPDSVMDRVMIEYRGGRQSVPELQTRILPEEKEYSCDEMRKVYSGIFVRQKVLFEGEILEYRIYETGDGGSELMAEGSLSGGNGQNGKEGSRFEALNEMGRCLSQKEEGRLKEKMKKYLTDNAMMEELFFLL